MAAAGVMTANPALVAGGASVVAGDIAAEGAKKAAKQQEDAALAAKTTQEAAAKTSAAAFQPFQATGQAAYSTLGSMLGLAPAAQAGGSPSSLSSTTGMASDAGTRMGVPRTDDGPQQRAARQSQSSYAPTLGDMAGGNVVQLRAPTGEVAMVPKAKAPFYAARGAQIIGFNGQPVGEVLP
jgi:hypothetical protein